MAAFILVIVFILCGREALQHYKAEKYAMKVVHGVDIDFFGFMLEKHPLIFIGGIFAFIIVIAMCFVS